MLHLKILDSKVVRDGVKFADDLNDFDLKEELSPATNTNLLRSISHKFKENRVKCIHFFYSVQKFEYTILFFLVLLLTLTQIVFIHDVHYDYFKSMRHAKNNSAIIKFMCNKIESNYMTEELIIMPFAIIFFTILWAKTKTRRFNKFIMTKFRGYFRSKLFKEIQKEHRIRREEIIKVT